MYPSRTSGAPVAYSSTSDVSGSYRTGIFGSRPWILMYVAHHEKEQELGTVQTDPLRRTADCQDKDDLDFQVSFVA